LHASIVWKPAISAIANFCGTAFLNCELIRACFINIRVCDGGHFRPVLEERLQQYVDIAKKADTEMGGNGPVPKGCRQKSRLQRCSSWQ